LELLKAIGKHFQRDSTEYSGVKGEIPVLMQWLENLRNLHNSSEWSVGQDGDYVPIEKSLMDKLQKAINDLLSGVIDSSSITDIDGVMEALVAMKNAGNWIKICLIVKKLK
jgi:hypothetical protein